MAEEALKKLEEQLNCSVCLDTYTDPKMLQCFHVYCRQCLVRLVVRDQQGKLGLTCPTCRQVTPVPDRGVAGLQSAFHINRFLEIQASLQNLDKPAENLEKATKCCDVEDPPPCKDGQCSDHSEELKLFCETCGELVCVECIVKGGRHHDHECALLKTAFERYTDETVSLLEPMEKQVAVIKGALSELDARTEEICNSQAATEENIHTTFRKLHEVLNVRKAELISQLDRMTNEKLKILASQRDQIETTLARLNSCLHYMRESLKTGNEGDVLVLKHSTKKRVKELTSPFKSDLLEPRAVSDIEFNPTSADMATVCQNYGQVCIPTSPDVSKFRIISKTAGDLAVGEMSAVLLQAMSFSGQPCEKSIESLECELVSEITGARTSCNVTGTGQGRYKIGFQPSIKGRHQLQITVGGQHVDGSPFSIAVKSLVHSISTPALTISGLGGPRGIALTERHEIVVAERGYHSVSIFSPSGKKLRSFGKFGFDNGEFQGPHGVAVDAEGNILVADEGNHRIQTFKEGQFLAAAGTKGSGPLGFHHPSDIIYNASNGKIYVVDRGNNRIQVLNFDLTFCFSFGKEGSGKGQFRCPSTLACDGTGKVYVVDTDNRRIQVFTPEGKFLRMFGRRGQGRGEMDYPIYLAIDATGNVFVSEGSNDRVSLFTPDGQFLMSFGTSGRGAGEFSSPRGLVVDNYGVVYVCDSDNNRVQIF